MKKGLLLVLAAGWALLAFGWVQRRVMGPMNHAGDFTGGWPDRIKLATAPRPDREGFMTGDEALRKFLVSAKANLGGAKKVYVLAFDPGRHDLFQWYRCAFELFPVRVWYAPGPELPVERKEIRLAVDPEFAHKMADNGINRVAYFHKPDPAKSMWFSASVTAKPELVLRPLAAPEPAPVSATPSRIGWWLGWLLLLPLGFGLSSATGLDAAFRDRPTARAALAWLLGVGGTAWLMQALSLAGIRWSLPLVLIAWGPIVFIGGVRALQARNQPSAGHDPTPTAPVPPLHASAPAWLCPVGLSLLALAALLALIEVHIPVGAWGNWDAWAIWGLKAKACWEAKGIPFGFLGEPQYTFAHPDYPNGLPSVQCFLGMVAGGLDEALLRLLSFGHFLALLMLLPVVLRDLGAGPWSFPLAGAIALLPRLQEFATLGYGDLPIAAWGVAVLAVLVRIDARKVAPWTAALVGGLATQVKDEGLLWAAGGCLVLAMWTYRGRVSRGALALAATAACAVVLPWRMELAILGIAPNDYSVHPILMLTAMPDRIPFALSHYARLMWWPGSLELLERTWGLSWHGVAGLAAVGAAQLSRPPYRDLLVVPVTVAVGVLLVYLASRHGVAYHVESTAERILVQLWPAVAVIMAGAAFSARMPTRSAAVPGRSA